MKTKGPQRSEAEVFLYFYIYNACLFIFLDDSNKVTIDSIQPLPQKRPHNPQNSSKPPSLIYTSPESLAFIKSRDKDATEDFDKDSPVGRKNTKNKKNNLKRRLAYGEASTSSGAKRSKRKAAAGVKAAVKAVAEVATDDSQSEDEDPMPHWRPKKMEIGRKSGKLPILKQELYYKCGVCKKKASPNSEYFWIYCPVCLLINHLDCFERSCFCGFKPKPGQIKKNKTNKK